MTELFTILACVTALLCVPAWLYRGGSLMQDAIKGTFLDDRWLRRGATPVVVACSLFVVYGPDLWSSLAIAGGAVLFTAASADGWKNTTDMGMDGDRPFWKELLILQVRFLWFLLPLVSLYFAPWQTWIPTTVLAVLGPSAWVIERQVWRRHGKMPGFAFAETAIGGLLAVSTIAAVLLA